MVVIAGYNHPTMMMAIAWCVLTRTPFVMQGETWIERTGLKSSLKRKLLHPVLFKAGAFLVTGTLGKKYWVSQGYERSRIRVFANTPDVDFFMRKRDDISNDEASKLRAQWKCGDRRLAVFVGRLIKVKGMDLLIQALKEIDDTSRPFVVIVGGGTEREQLEEMAKGLPVAFVGFLQIEHLPAIYAAADYFILPSRVEPWGVVVNEAAACGLPLCLSDQVGAHADLLQPGIDGGNGLLVEGPNIDNLKSAIMRMSEATDADFRRMGVRSREIVQSWKYDASVKGFEEACELACK